MSDINKHVVRYFNFLEGFDRQNRENKVMAGRRAAVKPPPPPAMAGYRMERKPDGSWGRAAPPPKPEVDPSAQAKLARSKARKGARRFNPDARPNLDAEFHKLHTEYSKLKAEVRFHHHHIDNPRHPANHADNEVSYAAHMHQHLVDRDYDTPAPSQATIDKSKQNLINMHPDVKKHYDKADSLGKKYRASHKAMWAHIDKHGLPDNFNDTSPNDGNTKIIDKHYSSLEKSAQGK